MSYCWLCSGRLMGHGHWYRDEEGEGRRICDGCYERCCEETYAWEQAVANDYDLVNEDLKRRNQPPTAGGHEVI